MVRPDYVDALTYKIALLKMLARVTTSESDRAGIIAQARSLQGRAAALGAAQAPAKLPRSPEFAAAVERLKPLRVGGEIKPPSRVKNVNAVYPPDALASRVQGVVILELIVDATGHVSDVAVLRSIPMLDEAALEAVKQWEYTPTLLNGAPVPVLMTVTVNFTLR
jgi:TonB family protein